MSDLIRNLNSEDLQEMYKAFKMAFQDYPIPFDLSEEHFRKKFVNKLNISLDLSAGSFSNNILNGFIFTSVCLYDDILTAYNGGTGVVPVCRGNGLTSDIYNYLIPGFRKQNISMCILEVLTENKAAIKVYKKIGFRITRNYKCYKLNPFNPVSRKENNQILLAVASKPNWSKYNEFLDYMPSYLDSHGMIEKNLENEVIVEAKLNNVIVGYSIFQPETGRISHIAVDKTQRNNGIGTMLIRFIYSNSIQKALTIINIPDDTDSLLSFLVRSGFENELNQYEMRLML
jgi:ribosomal protein S18 acetylase RimI-like enzyme